MKLTLIVDGNEKNYVSGKVTFKRFREATTLLTRFTNDEFLSVDYPQSEMDEAVNLICDYFGVSQEEFEDGFHVEDSTDFFTLFLEVLSNIQLNDGKRKVETDTEGK